MGELDSIDNLSLIENCSHHLQFELERENPSFFRIAREAHLLLYRSMIEALKGSANLAVMGRPSGNRSCKYLKGSRSWQEIHKVSVKGCSCAWRFSKPKTCEEPTGNKVGKSQHDNQDYLIGFYDALAMIQTECFMGKYVHSNSVPVSDIQMKTLEWLHERIRNEYEHFVPKFYTAPINDLLEAAELCLHLAIALLFKSGNVLFVDDTSNNIKVLLDENLLRIQSIMGHP